MQPDAPLLREIIVWRRRGDREAIRYTCLENLLTGLFCVQVADFVRLPFDEQQDRQQRQNRIELLIEGQIEACPWHASLKAAIEDHDKAFDNPLDTAHPVE